MSSGRVLMVQGTSSSAGKSFLVTALCRIFARRGWHVAPFKAQNMSNNAAVCPDGAEIGRAQALQARAAGIEPRAEMNPILIKPEADSRAQVVVMGRPWRTLSAGMYYRHRDHLWSVVTNALDTLREEYDLVIIEGAGSPAELNLKAGDIVNMAVARYAEAPVLLVGDIDRGGIFAQLLGTFWLLEPEEQALVRGFVVNKFRGDLTLFSEGIRILEERGRRPVLGVIPYIPHLFLPDEDAVPLEEGKGESEKPLGGEGDGRSSTIDIVVLHLPRIANFDDFDPLRVEPDVRVRFVSSPRYLGQPDAIIVPGSKSTVADLEWLHDTGLATAVRHLAEQGSAVVGICGGYQMLGREIRDPQHVESTMERVEGLGLLPTVTTFTREKATYQVRARVRQHLSWLASLHDVTLAGYEIHMGHTKTSSPWLEILERGDQHVHIPDGAMSSDGRIWGTYIHGFFANDALRRAWLEFLRRRKAGAGVGSSEFNINDLLEHSLDRLADVVEEALNMKLIEQWWDS